MNRLLLPLIILITLLTTTATAQDLEGYRDGKHEYEYKDGRIYIGMWHDFLPHGEGKMRVLSGDWYSGIWTGGILRGQGKIYFVNGDVYEGEINNMNMNGMGKLIYADGAHYVGSFADGKANGHGVLTKKNGDVFSGNFVNGKAQGRLDVSYADGSTFQGTITADGLRTGHVRTGTPDDFEEHDVANGKIVGDIRQCVKRPDGEEIIVFFIDGDKKIIKELTLSNGCHVSYRPPYTRDEDGRMNGTIISEKSIYDGQIKNVTADGKGMRTWKSGGTFKGTFKDGEPWDGECIGAHFEDERGNDFATYTGMLRNGKMNGNGTEIFADGNIYNGDFIDNRREGKGTFIFADGDIYTGSFVNSKFEGQGTYTWTDGQNYVGEWKDDKINGKGTMTYAPGKPLIKTQGTYVDGKLRKGTATLVQGVVKGEWDENGVKIK